MSDYTTLTLQQMLDRAFRQCRVVPQNISGEMIETGIEALQDMLDALPTRITSLWARDHQLVAMPDGAARVALPASSIDIIDMRRREWRQRHTGPFIDYDEHPTMELDGREQIAVVGVMFNVSGEYNFTIETSLDGETYTVFKAPTQQIYDAHVMYWFEAEPLLRVNYVRLNGVDRDLVEELYLGEDAYDTPMERYNQENFSYLPPSREGAPLSYWVDKQAVNPVLCLWPRPNGDMKYAALHVYRQRHADISGRLRDEIEIPRRWKEGLVTMLAYRIALNTPQIDINISTTLKPIADEMALLLGADERDPAPITVHLGISGYTR